MTYFGFYDKERIKEIFIPNNLNNKFELFDFFSHTLELPKWFGKNWDALEDSLRDLNWIKEAVLIFTHSDIPFDNDPLEQKLYLDILIECINHWKDKPIAFIALFPKNEKKRLEMLIKKYKIPEQPFDSE